MDDPTASVVQPPMRPTILRRHSTRGRRGVALLMTLIALVLLAALALEVAQTAVTQDRVGKNTMYDFLLKSTVDGRVHILRSALRFDQTSGENLDTEADDWAWHSHDTLSNWGERSTDPPSGEEGTVTYRNTDVKLQAWCEDERSKLNLLGLSRPEDTPERRFTRETLIRLIDEFREDYGDLDLTDSDGREMVEELEEWLRDQSDSEENPMPDVPTGRGRLQSVDDLLRVPGGRWKRSVLYDVQDPDYDPEEGDDLQAEGGDQEWSRQNGIPGLINYLTVHAESTQNAPLRININTVGKPLLRALFDSTDADLADDIIEHRREGADAEEDETSNPPDDENATGFFANKGQLTRVEGMGESLDAYERLNFFADVVSSVFSIRVQASMVTGTVNSLGELEEDEDSEGPRDVLASYQYREVVQRTDNGFLTLFVERRHDPLVEEQE